MLCAARCHYSVVNFLPNPHNRHPRYWVSVVILISEILSLLSQYRMSNPDESDRVITAFVFILHNALLFWYQLHTIKCVMFVHCLLRDFELSCALLRRLRTIIHSYHKGNVKKPRNQKLSIFSMQDKSWTICCILVQFKYKGVQLLFITVYWSNICIHNAGRHPVTTSFGI